MINILQRIKIRKEDELRERLENHPLYQETVQSLGAVDPRDNYELGLREYLRTGAELSAQSYGPLFSLMDRSAHRLGVSVRARVFKVVRPGGIENATVMAAGNEALIAFHDGLLNTVSDDQSLSSILGHELAHFAFGHTADRASLAVQLVECDLDALEEGVRLPAAQVKTLRRVLKDPRWEELVLLNLLLSQVCELNADRAGLLCAENFEASVRGSMLLTAGPADRFGRYEATDYLGQAKELLARDDVFDEADAFRSHPLEPLRVLALEHFAKSDVFCELTGQGAATHSLDTFDDVLAKVVPLQFLEPNKRRAAAAPPRVTEPARADAPPSGAPGLLSEHEQALLAYICVSSVLVADGKLTPREQTFFSQQVRPAELADRVISETGAMTDEEYEAVRSAALDKARALPPRAKTALIKLMIKAAKADRRITDTEVAAIGEVAARLDAVEQARRQVENTWGTGR